MLKIHRSPNGSGGCIANVCKLYGNLCDYASSEVCTPWLELDFGGRKFQFSKVVCTDRITRHYNQFSPKINRSESIAWNAINKVDDDHARGIIITKRCVEVKHRVLLRFRGPRFWKDCSIETPNYRFVRSLIFNCNLDDSLIIIRQLQTAINF